jgi:hypothetical protein
MESTFFTFIALTSMASSLWVLSDIWRILVLEILLCLHRSEKRAIVDHIIAAHMRVIYKYDEVDFCLEELSETIIEILEPFVD